MFDITLCLKGSLSQSYFPFARQSRKQIPLSIVCMLLERIHSVDLGFTNSARNTIMTKEMLSGIPL